MYYILFLVLLGCGAGQVSKPKYLLLQQDRRGQKVSIRAEKKLLIHKVKEGIKFKLQGSCSEGKQKLTKKALLKWTEVLSKSFDIHIPEPKHVHYGEDFTIDYVCRNGRSYANISNQFTKIYKENGRHNFGTIVHEIGHLFGLADTYVLDRDIPKDQRSANRAEWLIIFGNRRIKDQPRSIMNEVGGTKLFEDDKQAIRHLYKYYVLDEISLYECEKGTGHVSANGGCGKEAKQDEFTSIDNLEDKNILCFGRDNNGKQVVIHSISAFVINLSKKTFSMVSNSYGDESASIPITQAGYQAVISESTDAFDLLFDSIRPVKATKYRWSPTNCFTNKEVL